MTIRKCLLLKKIFAVFLVLILFLKHFAYASESTNIDTGQRALGFFNQLNLLAFDFKTLDSIRIAASTDTLQQLKNLGANAVYQINNKEIIFDGICPKKYHDSSCLYWGNLQNGNYRFLSTGELSAYFHDTQQVFYLKNYSKLNNYITLATLNNGQLDHPSPILKSFWAKQNIIRIDPEHFVIDDFEHPGSVMLYEVSKKTLSKLDIPFCYARLWVSSENRLLCNNEQHQFFLASIDGKNLVKNINLKGSDVGVVGYDPSKNEMLMSRLIPSFYSLETPSLWKFNFNTNREKFIKYLY